MSRKSFGLLALIAAVPVSFYQHFYDNSSFNCWKRAPVAVEFSEMGASFEALDFAPREFGEEYDLEEECGFNNRVAYAPADGVIQICLSPYQNYDFSADGRTVVFPSLINKEGKPSDYGYPQVFLLSLDGDTGAASPSLTVLSGGLALDGELSDNRAPSVSADGNVVAFSRGRDVVVANMREGSLYRLFEGNSPDVSSNGKRIVFTAYDRAYDVFVADLETRTVSNISNHDAHDQQGVISPNGELVAFVSYRNCPGDDALQNPDVYVVDLEERTLANVLQSNRCDAEDAHHISGLTFSGNDELDFVVTVGHLERSYTLDLRTAERSYVEGWEKMGSQPYTFVAENGSVLSVSGYGVMRICDSLENEICNNLNP